MMMVVVVVVIEDSTYLDCRNWVVVARVREWKGEREVEEDASSNCILQAPGISAPTHSLTCRPLGTHLVFLASKTLDSHLMLLLVVVSVANECRPLWRPCFSKIPLSFCLLLTWSWFTSVQCSGVVNAKTFAISAAAAAAVSAQR